MRTRIDPLSRRFLCLLFIKRFMLIETLRPKIIELPDRANKRLLEEMSRCFTFPKILFLN